MKYVKVEWTINTSMQLSPEQVKHIDHTDIYRRTIGDEDIMEPRFAKNLAGLGMVKISKRTKVPLVIAIIPKKQEDINGEITDEPDSIR